MSVNKFKVGDVVKCVAAEILSTLTVGKDYVVLDVSNGGNIKVENDRGNCFYYYSYRFELSNGGSANAQQTHKSHKFKEGDVVKCVDSGIFTSLTIGKDYVLLDVSDDGDIKVENDKGNYSYYYPHRFELSNGGSANAQQTHKSPKFKDGDMVYLIGFDFLKPRKLLTKLNNNSPMKFEVEAVNGVFETFTEDGKYRNNHDAPSIVIATEENRLILNKLLGVEYEPVKLTGSDLAKKLLKDKPQTCYVSATSDDYAKSSGGVVLIMEYENDRFISKMGVDWKFAVPCNQHGRVLEDE